MVVDELTWARSLLLLGLRDVLFDRPWPLALGTCAYTHPPAESPTQGYLTMQSRVHYVVVAVVCLIIVNAFDVSDAVALFVMRWVERCAFFESLSVPSHNRCLLLFYLVCIHV